MDTLDMLKGEGHSVIEYAQCAMVVSTLCWDTPSIAMTPPNRLRAARWLCALLFSSLALAASAALCWGQLPLSGPARKELQRQGHEQDFYDPQEKCPGSRKRTGEARFGEYIVRTYRYPNDAGCFEILQRGRQAHSKIGLVFQIGGSPDFAEEPTKLLRIGADIRGDGTPGLVIGEWTGGAHCCLLFHVFDLGKKLRTVATIDAQHAGNSRFADVGRDGKLEFETFDYTFAYWHASFAESPAPAIILRYRNGRFRFAEELMRKPSLPEPELTARAQKLRNAPEWESPDDPPSGLWSEMLDLIYTGNAPQAWRFFDLAWPAGRKGKEEFLREFRAKLAKSPYWSDVEGLNRSQVR